MSKKMGIKKKNFLFLVSWIFVFTIIGAYFIYMNTVSDVQEEIYSGNMSKTIQIENSFAEMVRQGEQLAAEISILDETKLFWNMQSPEYVDTSFYLKLKSYLKNLNYLLNSTISSIILYAPKYERIFDQDMSVPYYLSSDIDGRYKENTDWIENLENVEGERYADSIQIRVAQNHYPYVMTVIKQYAESKGFGTVAVDIDLKKMYRELSSLLTSEESIWILDQEARVIVCEDKRELYGETATYPVLSLFENRKDTLQKMEQVEGYTTVYTQKYCEEYEVFIVVASRLDNFDMRVQSIGRKIIGSAVLFLIIASVLLSCYVMISYRPFKKILDVLDTADSISKDSADLEHMENEVSQIVNKILETVQKNRALSEELEKRMDLLAETKLQALKSQINPHFLFNTLNVIVMMIDEENPESSAAQMIVELAEILNYSLSDEEMVTVAQEMDYIKRYIGIMRIRYKNRFRIEYEIPEALMDVKIPKLILQPLIENAIFHGVNEKTATDAGLIRVSAKTQPDSAEKSEVAMIQLTVEDNGKGMSREKIAEIQERITQEKVSMRHIGVQNTAKRIALLYAKRGKMEIFSEEGKGTRIVVEFPVTPEA